MGPDLSWSPGGTTHHALQMGGGTGGLGGPSKKPVLGGDSEEEVPQPRPTMGGPDTGLRLRGGGRGHKVSVPEGPSGQALPRTQAHRAGWGTLWT